MFPYLPRRSPRSAGEQTAHTAPGHDKKAPGQPSPPNNPPRESVNSQFSGLLPSCRRCLLTTGAEPTSLHITEQPRQLRAAPDTPAHSLSSLLQPEPGDTAMFLHKDRRLRVKQLEMLEVLDSETERRRTRIPNEAQTDYGGRTLIPISYTLHHTSCSLLPSLLSTPFPLLLTPHSTPYCLLLAF